MKLNAYLSRNGYSSRRKAAILVKDGKVTVNGKIVTEPWYEVRPADAIKAEGHSVVSKRHVYIIINKPKGVTSTLEDPFALRKVTDLVPAKFGRVYPVGRLDKDSRGLMILTTDGDLCYSLTHPKFEVEKEYVVTVKSPVDEILIKKIRRGVMDKGEMLKVKSATVEKSSPDKAIVRVVASEGKKRHLRRLFGFFGLDVVDLVRVRIAGLRMGDLKDGRFRVIERAELERLLGVKTTAEK